MSLILLIDTATEGAMVSLAKDADILHTLYHESPKDHASFLQPAIKKLVAQCGLSITNIEAVAISAGPGSYTGLRVGMSSAKGLCYALRIPLITHHTLEILAVSAILPNKDHLEYSTALFCPMIDARRMEVYAAIYTAEMELLLPPSSCILTDHSFEKLLQENRMIFFGNGAKKWGQLCNHPNALFQPVVLNPEAMAGIAESHLMQKKIASLEESVPFYLKEHYIFPEKYKKVEKK